MEDLDASRDTCEQTSCSNRLRTDIREISQAASKVRKSLQTCGLVNNKEVLEGHIQRLVEAEVKLRQSQTQANESSENLKFCKSQDLRDLFGPREAKQ